MLALGMVPRELSEPDLTIIDHNTPRPVAPERGVTVEYGKYLAMTCTMCHGSNLNGQIIRISGTNYVAPNLTTGGELGTWSKADFFATLRRGVRPGGQPLKDVMPWKFVGQMTEDELSAVWMYLRSLPSLEQGK